MFLKEIAFCGIAFIGSACHGQSSSPLTIQQVLANPHIWGKDLPTALADVSAMRKTGETHVAIFSNKVESTSGKKPAEADIHMADLLRALTSVSAFETSEYHRVLDCNHGPKAVCASPVSTRFQRIEKVDNNDKVEVAAISTRLQFLKPETSIATIKSELGTPEQVTQEVIQTKYERRPTILTKYKYASGAVVFATSNLKPNGKLDRVILNTDAVANALNAASK
jgi:hypothetical protein